MLKAMILAAGRGERLRPLTDRVPKPLLEVGGERLIERHLRRLSEVGIDEVVINVSHLGQQIEDALGSGREFDLAIRYSREADGPLETAGGIAHALPLLGETAFLAVNADIWTDFDFSQLLKNNGPAHLVVVPNPSFKAAGDFTPAAPHLLRQAHNTHTFSGIAVYQPSLFVGLPAGSAPLAPMLFDLSASGELTGQVHPGRWFDIGTAERLKQANDAIAATGT